mgnify:FL=1
MPFFIRHPEHGYHNVYTPEDLTAHEALGWTPVPDEAKAEASPVPVPSGLTLAQRYEAKFGKEPHHRMLRRTIEAALKD